MTKRIKIPNIEYCAMFESKIVKSGNGAVAKALKKYLNKDVVILVKADIEDIEDKEFIKKYK